MALNDCKYAFGGFAFAMRDLFSIFVELLPNVSFSR